jgi:hypothetical protein
VFKDNAIIDKLPYDAVKFISDRITDKTLDFNSDLQIRFLCRYQFLRSKIDIKVNACEFELEGIVRNRPSSRISACLTV